MRKYRHGENIRMWTEQKVNILTTLKGSYES